jgi:hypothetical protein
MLIVQTLVGTRGIEDVKRTLSTHAKAFSQQRDNTPYLVPH